jgi:hypothetical protein
MSTLRTAAVAINDIDAGDIAHTEPVAVAVHIATYSPAVVVFMVAVAPDTTSELYGPVTDHVYPIPLGDGASFVIVVQSVIVVRCTPPVIVAAAENVITFVAPVVRQSMTGVAVKLLKIKPAGMRQNVFVTGAFVKQVSAIPSPFESQL